MKKYNQFEDLVELLVEQQLEENRNKSIAKRLQEDGEYQKFFKTALTKFDVKSPKDFKSDEKKAEFFDYVDKNYKQKSESVTEDYKALEKDRAPDLAVMKAYIEEKYPQDSELKRIYNDMLDGIKINSIVVSWKKIQPIK